MSAFGSTLNLQQAYYIIFLFLNFIFGIWTQPAYFIRPFYGHIHTAPTYMHIYYTITATATAFFKVAGQNNSFDPFFIRINRGEPCQFLSTGSSHSSFWGQQANFSGGSYSVLIANNEIQLLFFLSYPLSSCGLWANGCFWGFYLDWVKDFLWVRWRAQTGRHFGQFCVLALKWI